MVFSQNKFVECQNIAHFTTLSMTEIDMTKRKLAETLGRRNGKIGRADRRPVADVAF